MKKDRVFDVRGKWIRMESVPTPNETIKYKAELNIYKIAIPLYWIIRLFGMLPFSLQRSNDNGEVENVMVTILDKIWFALSLCSYCLLAYLGIAFSLNDTRKESSTFVYAASNCILCLGLVHGIFTISKNMFQREQILRCLHELNACDKELRALGMQINHQKQKLFVISVFSTFFICGCIFIAITAYWNYKYYDENGALAIAITYAAYLSKTSIFSSNLIVYIFKLLALRSRYKLLNKLIRLGIDCKSEIII